MVAGAWPPSGARARAPACACSSGPSSSATASRRARSPWTASRSTIAALREDGVEIALVPFTLEQTTLGALDPGAEVNVEVDLLAKYAERLASA